MVSHPRVERGPRKMASDARAHKTTELRQLPWGSSELSEGRFATVVCRGPNIWLAVALVVAVTYTPGYRLPSPGLDPSWWLGLSWAHELHLQWGTDIAYTYGPWGFLGLAVPLTWAISALAFAFWLVVLSLIAFATFRLAEVHGRWLAFGGSLIIGTQATCCAYPAAALIAVVLLSCALILRRTTHPAVVVIVGSLAGFSTMIKFNLGMTSVVVVLVAALALQPRWSRLGLMGLSIAAGFAGGWTAASQAVANVPAYFQQSIEIALHYPLGLGSIPAERSFISRLWPVFGAAVLLLTVTIAILASRGVARSQRIALLSVVVSSAISFYAASGIRLDPGHAVFLTTFLSTVGVALALAWHSPRFKWLPVITSVGLAAGGVIAQSIIIGASPLQLLSHPGNSLKQLAVAVARLANYSEWESLLMAQRTAILRTYNVGLEAQNPMLVSLTPPTKEVIAALAGQRVHAEPWAVSAVWASGLAWKPVPVFQTHQAYSPALDNLNAKSITSPSGPTGVLRQSAAIDHKNPLWESPSYQVQLICNFDQRAIDTSWQALVRVPNKCGSPEPLSTSYVTAGVQVQVPSIDGQLIVMNVNPSTSGGLMPLGYPTITCNSRSYRVAQGFPTGPLLVNAIDSGWSTHFLPEACQTISVSQDSSISFSAVPISSK